MSASVILHRGILPRLALALFVVFGTISQVAWAGDLSSYRNFKLGTDLPTIARQAGTSSSQATVIDSRPALIQELEWHPQPLGPSSQTESVKDIVFSFYNGELYRIVVNYDQYETEGLTAEDMIDAISLMYGSAVRPAAPVKPTEDRYGNQQEVLARWQDPQYCFELTRLSYGPTFKLTGNLKRLEAPVRAAIHESARLDQQEAPQRDAERIATELKAERAKQEKARLANKPKFRP